MKELPQVEVLVSTSLKRLKGCERGRLSLRLKPGTTIADLLQSLGAVPGEVELIILNGEKVGSEVILKDGDAIELYPVFGGG